MAGEGVDSNRRGRVRVVCNGEGDDVPVSRGIRLKEVRKRVRSAVGAIGVEGPEGVEGVQGVGSLEGFEALEAF